MKIYYLYIILFAAQFNYGQNQKIEKIQLSDSILVKNVKNFILKIKEDNIKFKDIGYIEIKTIYYNREAKKNELLLKYQIKDQYYRPNSKKQYLPKYYCYVENKLVLLYDISFQIYSKKKYSKKNQKRINKIVKPFLKKPIHLKIKDNNDNIVINDKKFIDEEYNIHGGIILSIFNNGKFEVE